jgi:acetyl-CoA acetyltransferase
LFAKGHARTKESCFKKAVILRGVRTPVGRYMGALREVFAFDLGALVLSEAIRKAGVEAKERFTVEPIKVVPYPAGGGTDVSACLLADELEPILGEKVIVVNKEGGPSTLVP